MRIRDCKLGDKIRIGSFEYIVTDISDPNNFGIQAFYEDSRSLGKPIYGCMSATIDEIIKTYKVRK